MILVTGASGKTGLAVIRALSSINKQVRAFIHNPKYSESVKIAGSSEIIVGDIENPIDVDLALKEIDVVYHICPNMHPREFEIGKLLVNRCHNFGTHRFIYHSVLHPQIISMPHHWQKLHVEELLYQSKLDFTILQPTVYMQNILGYLDNIHSGNLSLPYPGSTKLSLIDLEDIAEAVINVIINPTHSFSTYELVGTYPISQYELCEALSQHIDKYILPTEVSIDTWKINAKTSGLNEYSINSLASMFDYYTKYGLSGNPNVLTWLIRRKPTSLVEFIQKNIPAISKEII